MTCGSRRATSAGATIRSLPRRAVPQFRKNRFAAGDLDKLLDPLNAGDERIVPLFEEHAGADRQPLGTASNVIHTRLELNCERGSAVPGADERTDHANRLQDLCDASLVERHHRIAASNQLRRDVGLQIREPQHQVGPQRFDLLESRIDERRHLRFRPRLRRPHRIAGDANDTISFAEQI